MSILLIFKEVKMKFVIFVTKNKHVSKTFFHRSEKYLNNFKKKNNSKVLLIKNRQTIVS